MPLDVLRVGGFVSRRAGGDYVVSCDGIIRDFACCGGCALEDWATMWVSFAFLSVFAEDRGRARGGGAGEGSRLGCERHPLGSWTRLRCVGGLIASIREPSPQSGGEGGPVSSQLRSALWREIM